MAGAAPSLSGGEKEEEEEASISTPLLPPSPTTKKPPPPPWTHDLLRQLHLQLLLSFLALLLALLLVLVAALVSPAGGWAIASLALGATGMALDAGGLAALLRHSRRRHQAEEEKEDEGGSSSSSSGGGGGGGISSPSLLPLTLQLLFNAGALTPFCIVAAVLAFTAPSSEEDGAEGGEGETTTALALEGSLTVAVALASLSQCLVSVYFFRCLRLHRAFQEAVRQRRGKARASSLKSKQEQEDGAPPRLLPGEMLLDLFHALGQRPTATELAELAARDSASSSGGTGRNSTSSSGGGGLGSFDFEDFCRLHAHYQQVVGARKRRRLRQRARRRSLEEGALAAAAAREGSSTAPPSPPPPSGV